MTSFEDWFSFSGRITRRDYWLWYALLVAGLELAVAVLRLLLKAAAGGGMPVHFGDTDLLIRPGTVIGIVAGIAIFLGGLAGAVKRLHDRDRSGWFYLICLVPLIGPIWLAVEIGFLRGTFGPNRFGPDPLSAQRY